MSKGRKAPELQHVSVLFTDVVGYSKLPTDKQAEIVQQLTAAVQKSRAYRKAEDRKEMIPLPTGDGVALAFLGDPVTAVRCALELAATIRKDYPKLELRMGLNAGHAIQFEDIRKNPNLAGKGMNIAQRVMDFGDGGHLLASGGMAEILLDLSEWRDCLHDLDEHSAKHDVMIHVYNLLKDGLGNPETPAKLDAARKAPPVSPRRIHMAKAPRGEVVARPAEFDEAKKQLLHRHTPATVALSTALSGAGGYGKTTLAEALCADKEIQEALPDGILWVDVGQTPNILRELGRLYRELTGTNLATADEKEASELVARELKDRSVLLVIDDVWQRTHLKAFLDAAPNSARLITTRIVEILDPDVTLVRVDEMLPDQAVGVLLKGIPERPADMHPLLDLAKRLGRWALLLELANGKLRTLINRQGATLTAAVDFVSRLYQRHGLEAFDREDPVQRNEAAGKSIVLSLEMLDPSERGRYLDLGIFPEDTAVPSLVAVELWGVDALEAEEVLLRLDDLSLLKYDVAGGAFRLHDVFYDWLRRQGAGPATHARLLDRWGDLYHLPHAYAWRWIGWHLMQAGRAAQLRELLLDVSWMEAKLQHAGLDSLVAEYDFARSSETHRLVQRALTQSSHVIVTEPAELAGQLYARLLGVEEPGVAGLRAELRSRLGCIVPLWLALMQADSPLVRTLQGHALAVTSLALSGDGRTLVSGSYDSTIKVWELGTGREVRTLAGHTVWVTSLALSGDGRTLVSGSDDKTIKVWELGTGREVRRLEGHSGGVMSVALSGDGRTLVSGSYDNTIKVWELETGREVRTLEGHSGGVTSLALSGDGLTLVSGSYDKTIKVWELGTGREVRTLAGHAHWVRSLALSGDGRTLVSGSDDKTIKVWELGTGREVRRLEDYSSGVMSVALSGDGRTLVSGSYDNTIKVWELETGREVRTLEGHAHWVRSLALSGDGRTLVSGSDDKTIKVWELGTGREVRRLEGHSGGVMSVALSGDGRTLVSGSYDNTIKVWELETGREVRTLARYAGAVMSLALSGDGRTLVSGSDDNTIKVWDLGTGREVRTLAGHALAVTSLALSGDGRMLVSGSYDKTIKVWELGPGREVRTLAGHVSTVRSLALSGDGRTLVSGSGDNTIKVWELATGACVETFHADASILSVCLSRDASHVAAGDASGRVHLFEIRLGSGISES